MKTTIDLPDALMTDVKVLAARERRSLRNVVAELLASGLKSRVAEPVKDVSSLRAASARWLDDWFHLGESCAADAPSGASASQVLARDRSRQERR